MDIENKDTVRVITGVKRKSKGRKTEWMSYVCVRARARVCAWQK